MARLAGVVLVLVLALGFVRWAEPFATEPRQVVAGTPSPPGLFGAFGIKLKAGQTLCADQITVPDDARTLGFSAGTYSRPGPPLTVTLEGEGYRSAAKVAAGYTDNAGNSVKVKPAPDGGVVTKLCLRNEGRHAIQLLGTSEPRTRSRPENTIDGDRIEANVALTFYGDVSSVASRTGDVLAHAAAFRPFFLETPVLWLLLALVLVGLPLALVAALGLGLRESGAVVPTLADHAGATPPPAGALDRTGATFRELAERPAELWGRVLAWHRSLSERAQLWPLAAVTFLAWIWLARYGLRNHSFSIDQEGYVSTARFVKDLFPGSVFELEAYSRGLQRLHIFLLAGSFEAFGTAGGFTAFKWLNALVFASSAPAGYLLARALGVRRSFAQLAGVLCVLVPWAVTTTFILAEGVAYPYFIWLTLLVVRALSKPSLGRELAVWPALLLAPFARTSFLVVPAAYVAAVVVQELRFGGLRALPKRLALRHPITSTLVVLGVAAVGYRLATTPSLHDDQRAILGGYEDQTEAPFLVGKMLDSVAERLSRLAAGLAFVPAILGLPWIVRQLWRPTSPERHALAGFGVFAALGVFYTTWNSTFDERYFMYLAPLLIVATVCALDRRELSVAGVIAGAVATLVLLLSAPWSDARDVYRFFLLPAETFWAAKNVASPVFFVVMIGGLTWACIRAIRGSATALWGMLALVVVLQFWQTRYANANFVTQAGESTGAGIYDRAWVDEAVKGRGTTGLLLVGQGHTPDYQFIFRETTYWNLGITVQVALPTGPGAVPQIPEGRRLTGSDERTGKLTFDGPLPEFLVQPTRFRDIGLDAERVATSPYLPLELIRPRSMRALYRVFGAGYDGLLAPGKRVRIQVYQGRCVKLPLYALGGSGTQTYTITGPGLRKTGRLPDGGRATVSVPVKGVTELELAVRGRETVLPDGRKISIGVDSPQVAPRC